MNTDTINIIEQKIKDLSNEKKEYSFEELKAKVEEILSSVDIFMIENELNTKAVDMYLKNVINQRNSIKKIEEKNKIDNSQETKYTLIEAICKKLEFQNDIELIAKLEELEKKTNTELDEMLNGESNE